MICDAIDSEKASQRHFLQDSAKRRLETALEKLR